MPRAVLRHHVYAMYALQKRVWKHRTGIAHTCMYHIQLMHHFQRLDYTSNDWLDGMNRELSCGGRGTEDMHIGTVGAGDNAVVHAMRTSLSELIMKNGQQRLKLVPLSNSLEKVRLMYSAAHTQDLGRQIFARIPESSLVIAT